MIAACRRGAWVASQAMKSVTSFLNRLLAMAMEDQEVIFKYACCLHTWNTTLESCFLVPIAPLWSLKCRRHACEHAASCRLSESFWGKAVRMSEHHACTVWPEARVLERV